MNLCSDLSMISTWTEPLFCPGNGKRPRIREIWQPPSSKNVDLLTKKLSELWKAIEITWSSYQSQTHTGVLKPCRGVLQLCRGSYGHAEGSCGCAGGPASIKGGPVAMQGLLSHAEGFCRHKGGSCGHAEYESQATLEKIVLRAHSVRLIWGKRKSTKISKLPSAMFFS